MNNPLARAHHTQLADEMLEKASRLPKGYRTALVFADGLTVCFGHEQGSRVLTTIRALERRLIKQGFEPTALSRSEDGQAWAMIGILPPPRERARQVEKHIERLLRRKSQRTPQK
jgi:hypothetical protein